MTAFQKNSRLMWAALILVLAACSRDSGQQEEIIRPVRYETVYTTGGAQERWFSGAARANVESNLSFRVAGAVQRIHVKVGDQVRKGTPIAELDPTDHQLQVQDAEASLLQAQSQARNAAASYSRVQNLYVNQNASRADLDAALAAKESAEAQVASVEKKLELAKKQLDYTRLAAPVDGSIASVDVEVNENVVAGRTIVVLTGAGSPEVEVAVPEMLISGISEGSAVDIRFDALQGRMFAGVVTEVGVSSTGFATTYPVRVMITESTTSVRPGMAAEVLFRFNATGGRDRIIVPPFAVGEDNNGRFVFLVEPDGEGLGYARRTPVTVGELSALGLEITTGLEDGDLLITAGVSRISDGQKVRLNDAGEAR
jgi:RND family efflux transporter MFP subunit